MVSTMEESKGVALAILGIVAVVAVFGLVLLFTSEKTGNAWSDIVADCEGEAAEGRFSRYCDDILGADNVNRVNQEARGVAPSQYGDNYGYY
ncbi:MAG: hypothetical protein QGG83_02670 [Candidatus Woesearchaeota archaeon]|nr:hypothetical protein [Candidatus Woesearchaeota archaeon]MDP7646910.1 hypothetical protein [Candidatus Woesearchaeota archaeon]